MNKLMLRTGVGVAAAMTVILGYATGAFAATTDLDGGATADAMTQIKDFLTGPVALGFFAIALVAIGLQLGRSWAKRSAKG